MENAGPYRAFRRQPPNTGFSRKRKRRPRMAAETPPSRKRIGCGNKQEPLPRDPSFPAEKDADAEMATAVRLPSADRDHPVINNAGEKRKPANGPEQSVKEKRRTAIPESFHRFFLRFFIVMKVDLCYHKGT